MAEFTLWWVLYNNKISDTQMIEMVDTKTLKDLFAANHLEIIAIQDYQYNKVDVNEWKEQYCDSNSSCLCFGSELQG